MNGIKKARIEKCRRCKHRFDQHEQHAGPHGYSRWCGYPDEPIELHDSYMEGPNSNCPAGLWKDLDPIGPTDPDEWKKWNRDQNRKRLRNERKPEIKKTVQEIAQSKDIRTNAETALAVLVAAKAVPGWLADEINKEMGGGA